MHDTVQDFYTLYNTSVCPQASAEQATVKALASKFQSSCPANSVNIFVGVLQVLRKVITEIALILSTLVTIAVRLAALLFQVITLFITRRRRVHARSFRIRRASWM